jgi:hypothetical protein
MKVYLVMIGEVGWTHTRVLDALPHGIKQLKVL